MKVVPHSNLKTASNAHRLFRGVVKGCGRLCSLFYADFLDVEIHPFYSQGLETSFDFFPGLEGYSSSEYDSKNPSSADRIDSSAPYWRH